MPDSLSFFETLLHHTFQNPAYLLEAISHSSYANENKLPCNERLEFLGDAVLSIVVSEYLFNRRPAISEGDMSRIRAQSVCETALAAHARKMGIGPYLRLGKGEAASGGSDRASVLADAMEAIIGALFMDGGYDTAQQFVVRVFSETIDKAVGGKLFSDYKSEIQELLQAKGKGANIIYEIDREEGPAHDKTFFVHLEYNGQILGCGKGKSKKEAEQNAAKAALERGDS